MDILEVAQQMFIDRGKEMEADRQKKVFVTNLVSSTDFTDERIDQLADVPIAFIQQVRSSLQK
jgi:hypothetical protein